jgi:hypothetical protein
MRVGTGALALVSAGAALFIISRATADPGSSDTDEAIRTAPESFPNFSATANKPATAPAARAKTVAEQTPVPPLPLEAAQTSARAMRKWAEPRLAEATAFAARYQPTVEVKTNETVQGQTQTRVALALGPGPAEQVTDKLKHKVGFDSDTRSTYGNKGRWYLYAATSNDALGFNMLQGMHGEVRRAGFSNERVAAIGDRQAGLAWRKGSMQASLGYVERELSTFGSSLQQRFMALTVSFKAPGRPVTPPPHRISPYAPYSPDWPPQERDPRLRR